MYKKFETFRDEIDPYGEENWSEFDEDEFVVVVGTNLTGIVDRLTPDGYIVNTRLNGVSNHGKLYKEHELRLATNGEIREYLGF